MQDVMVSQDRFTIYRSTVTPQGDYYYYYYYYSTTAGSLNLTHPKPASTNTIPSPPPSP